MEVQKFRPVAEITLFAGVAFIFHKLFFLFFKTEKVGSFYYSLEELYVFFLSCSLLIILILIFIAKRNLDIVGNVFMGLTCVKMGAAYFVLYPVLHSGTGNSPFEKTNFFVVFALFLTLETIVTARLLNKK